MDIDNIPTDNEIISQLLMAEYRRLTKEFDAPQCEERYVVAELMRKVGRLHVRYNKRLEAEQSEAVSEAVDAVIQAPKKLWSKVPRVKFEKRS